ncbi:FixH family protein [Alteribacter natronophilus]|uniref:FixH family protein n=1 Tax=Alteribacter natronophilus TaxID=2583810 RepID=UPI00110D4886|nr:FixH family protein [Alteribacter natronophilus]TMW70317.1 FixH family protein [Alteribacter natronophilus]
MKKLLVMLAGAALIAAACGTEEEPENTNAGEEDTFGPVDVEVLMDDEGDPGDWTLEAEVTQDGNPVNNADEVVFEVWVQGNQEESDMIDYDNVEDGVYTAPYTFEEDGIYFVVPHVTARGQHVMPRHEIRVGDVDDSDVVEEEEDHDHSSDHDHEDHDSGDGNGHHHHHSDLVEAQTNFDSLEQDGRIEITVTKDGEPLEDGEVTLEIWQHGDEVRTWSDMNYEGEGIFTLDHDFEETGDYHVVIHIENDEIHEHLSDEFTIE